MIVIPNLILQPTWGGYYIANFKKLTQSELTKFKVGQSYELYEHTKFSSKTSTANQPTIEIGNPSKPQDAKLIGEDKPIKLQDLITQDPAGTLGGKVAELHGNKMQVLIKFTQAKGNSYQIHTQDQQDSTNWKPKPESWYFLQPGLVTLGAKPDVDWRAYQQACRSINEAAQSISKEILSKKISVAEGRVQLQSVIDKHQPSQYVNLVLTEINQGVDLSKGGVHHSWEEDSIRMPEGNIVYEVQRNVYDPESTIRSFDKGKIKSDGSIRKIQIDDYFKYIDRSPKANDPNTHFTTGNVLTSETNFTAKQIFDCPDYKLQELQFTDKLGNVYTDTKSETFHHLFVREGRVLVESSHGSWTVTQGYSVFIKGNTGQYHLSQTEENKPATILKTYI